MIMSTFPKKAENPARAEIIGELRLVQIDIDDARSRFNQATEQELIEQSVYELNALQARYTYFLRKLKEFDSANEIAGNSARVKTGGEVG